MRRWDCRVSAFGWGGATGPPRDLFVAERYVAPEIISINNIIVNINIIVINVFLDFCDAPLM